MNEEKAYKVNGKVVNYEKYLTYLINYLVSQYVASPDEYLQKKIIEKWEELKQLHRSN